MILGCAPRARLVPNMQDDGRLQEAKSMDILGVAGGLGIEGLRRAGHEMVGPCPVCGGRDRFGINPIKQMFNCRRCQGRGDVVALVQHVHGCNFVQALAYLVGEATAQIDPVVIAARKAKAAKIEKEREAYAAKCRTFALENARDFWRAAINGKGTIAEQYLAGRSVIFDAWPPTLRFIPNHPYMKTINNVRRELHCGPCMISAIQGPDHKLRAVHQTWIDPVTLGKAKISLDGKPQDVKLSRGSKKGGAIRLSPMIQGGTLVMGEGIETTGTALTAGGIDRAIYWAGVDLGNMAGLQERVPGQRNSGLPDMSDGQAFVPPQGIVRMIYLQDGDSAPGPTRAKLEAGLLRAMRTRPGLVGQIVHAGAGIDLNDLGQAQNKNEGGDV
jgi:hypothetical protein